MEFQGFDIIGLFLTVVACVLGVLLAKKNGKIGRKSYIIFTVLTVFFYVVAVYISAMITMGYKPEYILVTLSALISMIVAYLTARRCYDAGANPWIGLVVGFPFVGIFLVIYLMFAAPKMGR
ncbi:DUF805 domain-containing protein [Niveispirillum cyanobacteriorum]|uniref:Uncharacterized protein n=1 Tax=Niveispirillum cyanobacteriorum TaxID=1612173 RepID=A0A2K9N786_9PROT|nr:DUF805 domain-containing protein [Niveispirillum cyanobacteriorum]AUN28967.1 hypothetical protein C0V82_00900 [Niveispirillum cyanobacteriorum]GGE68718.1 hypothetical protein GCM10011317_27490 [Niveispirillum cyanobacteriorum]